MIFYHAPARLIVLTGDLPKRDYHYRFTAAKDWIMSVYARQRNVDSGRMAARSIRIIGAFIVPFVGSSEDCGLLEM